MKMKEGLLALMAATLHTAAGCENQTTGVPTGPTFRLETNLTDSSAEHIHRWWYLALQSMYRI